MKLKNIKIMNKHCTQCEGSEYRFSHTDKKFDFFGKFDNEDIPDVDYMDLKCEGSSVVHWGQLKLLLSEIFFLSNYKNVEKMCIVYIGCSPGHHLEVLVDIMPHTWQWRLYDKNICETFCNSCETSYFEKPLNRRGNRDKVTILRNKRHNVMVFNFDMSEREAAIINWKYMKQMPSEENPQLLCISDIRTATDEESVERDMNFQLRIIEIMRPYQASLKFKLPYSNLFPEIITYLDGDIFMQCYKPAISHECRLFTLKGISLLNKKKYHKTEFTKKNFYFQTNVRTSLYDLDDQTANPFDHPYLIQYGVASDLCYDCTCARKIMKTFTDSDDSLGLLEDIVKKLVEIQVRCKALEAKTKN